MIKLSAICDYMEAFAPQCLAEDWDNVGLLVGRREHDIAKIMTCLTVTPATVAEAMEGRVNLIITHHPIPFRPLKTITDDSVTGRLLLDLIASGVAIYSPHTSFDSTQDGINQQLAEALELQEIQPIRPLDPELPTTGAGRFGKLEDGVSVENIADRLKGFLKIKHLRLAGDRRGPARLVGVACGSAGQFLEDARANGCHLLVTGETSFHTCLEAAATNVALLLTGHYASERFAVETLAARLQGHFSGIEVWASRNESDPLSLI